MQRVIFACVHNAGRSQMAAAFFRELADPVRAAAVSAGTRPGDRVHPEVVDVMRELGIDLAGQRPQKLTEQLASGAFLIVTMGCGDECPYVPDSSATIGRLTIRRVSPWNRYEGFGTRSASGFPRSSTNMDGGGGDDDAGHSATHVSSVETSMPSAHSSREQTKLLEPNWPSPSTRLTFVCGWWQLGH